MPSPETILDGDVEFSGVNELLPPGQLQPGELASARNNRCRFGKAEPRLGCCKMPWSNLVTSGASSVPIPYGTVYGRGYFQDADAVLWGIVAADGKVYKFREGNGSSEIALPPGITITSAVSFTQTYNGLVMFRGLGNATLIMANLDAGFAVATQAANTITGALTENPTDGTANIPEADRGDWIDARLFVPTETATEKDLVNISDFLNATRFASVRSQGRINQGANDRLIRVFKFGRSHAAVCFKTASIYALYNTLGTLEEMEQDEITREFGLLSPRGVINVGKEEADMPDEVWFMGNTGSVYKIAGDASTGLLGVSALPVSQEMQKTIARVNRRIGASTVTFELWDDKLYIALPLDDATALGPELIRASPSYSSSAYTHYVVPGATYFWTKGANEVTLTNGTETLYESGQLTAQTSSVVFNGVSASAAVTASLKRQWVDVNNAVLVYDFVKGKWAGYDDGTAFTVQDWLKVTVDGEERLFFIGADGFINLAEALFDDETAYETFGDAIGSGSYSAGVFILTGLTVGRTYIVTFGGSEIRMTNGSEEIQIASGAAAVVVAQGTQFEFTGGGLEGDAGWSATVRLVDWTLEYEAVRHIRTTRAYRCQSLDRKRFPWVNLNLRTFDPSYTLKALLDGVNEEFTLRADRIKDNTKYLKPAGKARWVTTNYDEDHGTKYREDYHVELSDAVSNGTDIVEGQRYYVDSEDAFTAASITYNAVTYNRGETFVGVAAVTTWSVATGAPVVYPPGSYVLPGEDGIVLDLHQETEEDFRVGYGGREIQFVLDNAQGRAELVSLTVEGLQTDRRKQDQKG
jgi:hypothetical protein